MLVSDKRKEAKKLEDVGVERPKAEATVEVTISVVEKHAATKADLESLATKTDVAETNSKIDAARAEFYKSMTAGFDKQNESISKTNERISETNKDMAARFDKQNERASETNKDMTACFDKQDKSISETKVEIAAIKSEIIKWVVGTVMSAAVLVVMIMGILHTVT